MTEENETTTCEQCDEVLPVALGCIDGYDVGKFMFCESCFEDVQYDLGDAGLALAIYLGADPFSLTQSRYNSSSYEVNRHRAKQGNAPAHYVNNVQFLRTALEHVEINAKTRDELLAPDKRKDSRNTYYSIIDMFRGNPVTNEMMTEGVHRLVNTLWHVCNGHEDYVAAFNGSTPPDRRTSVWVNDGEYLAYTDDEADEALEEYLDTYIDDCVISELAEHAKNYFDREKWKRDAKGDGRGHSLSGYDGDENEQHYSDETYYIYRTN